MKSTATSVLLTAVALFGATVSFAQAPAPANPAARPARVSPHETVSQTFDGKRDNRVTITYGRPYSKDPKTGEIRKVWGALVPYGKVWRMGSDESTTLLLQQGIELGGTALPAGAYTLDMQPEEDGSAKLIVGKRLGQWGIPYKGDTEVARIDMKKEAAPARAEQFTILIERNPAGGGVIKAIWEDTQYSVPFTIAKAS